MNKDQTATRMPVARIKTSTLLLVLIAVLSWEVELGHLWLDWFMDGNIEPVANGVLVAVTATLSIVAYIRGGRDLLEFRGSDARAKLTYMQCAIVIAVMSLFGVLGAWVIDRIANH